ncbi:cation:proton antiporter [Bacteroidales bacterium OttesenSCG-928-E04]|nr:cation:proton antiporter [Bacteroidales bacterium OttesenSCG-928-E04]MDL2326556.1 cation:proton antiporter [Bacteroidales bacterium OttesenSCG-928-A14]
MSHLPTLISDLALILITAGVTTILFKWLKQPVVLGYIVAGFLISPHFVLLPSVADVANVSTWAEIGIIFLLFALGLEFSFKKLMAVGGTAGIATMINLLSMIAVGFLIGQLMGWSTMECIFLGGMISMSSTTIIIKAFNDMGLQKEKFANIVFGMLIVEDLAAIVMMVLFSTIAVGNHFEGAALFESVVKLLFFVVIWFVVGIYLIPTLLKKMQKFLSDETLLILVCGLCFGMVIFADNVGFSAALGAFIMGSILAESHEARRIEHLVEPLKNLFGAVFFVSVGMMIVPQVIVDYIIPILILTATVLVGRVIFATLGVLASGQGLKVALQSGFSLAQIGEFSFIIATLGMQLGVISDFIYPIIVAVSVITTFTTPYFIKLSTPIYNWIDRKLPANWMKLRQGYSENKQSNAKGESRWKRVLRATLVSVTIYFILGLAVFLLSSQFIIPWVTMKMPTTFGRILAAFITISLMTPFIAGIFTHRKSIRPDIYYLWKDKNFNKGILLSLSLLRLSLAIILILFVLIPLFSEATGVLLVISSFVLITILMIEGFRKRPARMEAIFFANLNSKDIVVKEIKEELFRFEIRAGSPFIDRSVKELDIRNRTGCTVINIEREGRPVEHFSRKMKIKQGDVLDVHGDVGELKYLETFLEQK